MPRRLGTAILFILLLGVRAGAQTPDAIEKIKEEGLKRSQVMQTLSTMTDVIGPRLTGSPQMKRANEWTKDQLTKWGLYNAHLAPWGPFGRGWTLQRFSAQVIEPQNIPLIGYPKAWSPGFKKPVNAPVVWVDAGTAADLDKYKGKLKGAIVLNGPIRKLEPYFDPKARRWTDEQLKDLAGRSGARPRPDRPEEGRRPRAGTANFNPEEFRARQELASRKMQFFLEEGVAVVMDGSSNGDGGTLFVQSATPVTPPPVPFGAGAQNAPRPRVAVWAKDAPKIVPQITLTPEHYNRMVRMIQQGEKLKMLVDLQVKYHDDDLMAYNTIAEIPGTDLKDEIVMLGGHLDSWHSATGTTDNAAGCAVAMEAVRILKTLGLQPRRTIRIALWSGEEHGLLGSRAYVTEKFGSRGTVSTTLRPGVTTNPPPGPAPIDKKPEYDKLSAYFNLDNGAGKIRGIYTQGNEGVKPIFEEWLKPFHELGAATVTVANTGGTDHQSFDGIGLPGFQFIQDSLEYSSRTHHSNMDTFERAIEDDLKQASVLMAAFVYHTAMRDEKLPRKTN